VTLRIVLAGAVAATAGGCGAEKRPALTPQQLIDRRAAADADGQAAGRELIGRILDRTKARHDEYAARNAGGGGGAAAPAIDILIISGGGDWGAFGAGFLKGWERVPAEAPTAKPDFSVVTGVSTGALIAPFAFIGDAASADRVDRLYRNPKKDWVKQRTLFFLPTHISFAGVPGLERELREALTPDMIARIAERGADGRMLVVNTTDIDTGMPHVFDLVAEARRARETGRPDRIYEVMLASSGIPGAFPPRMIDDTMYVDGGVTGNIIYGGRIGEEDSLPAQWQQRYPGVPLPKIRYWVIFNNQTRPLPQVTAPKWPAVVSRALETSSRSATLTAVRHLYAMSEVSRLKRKADIAIYRVEIPPDWSPPKPGVFVKETMNDLADVGERMGADPSSWKTDAP
jgi:hypothetical protein